MEAEHQIVLVNLSIMIAIITIYLIDDVAGGDEQKSRVRILSAGQAYVSAIWSISFIGMLAFRLPSAPVCDFFIKADSYLFFLVGQSFGGGFVVQRKANRCVFYRKRIESDDV